MSRQPTQQAPQQPTSPRTNDLKNVEQREASREAAEAEAEREFIRTQSSKDINWDSFEKNQFINKKQLGLLLDYDKQSKSDQTAILNEKGVSYAALFVHCLDSIRTKETVEYLIVLIDSMITDQDSNTRLSWFHELAQQTPPIDPIAPFLRVIESTDLGYHTYSISRATYITSLLLSSAPQVTPHHSNFSRHVISRLNASTTTNREILSLLNALKPFLRNESLQITFVENGGIKALANLLSRENANAQFIYAITFNLWLLSYNSQNAHAIAETGIFKRVVALLKTQIMEKVIRITFAFLRNITDNDANSSIHEELIGHQLPAIIDILSKRKYKDTDIAPDMEAVQSKLTDTVKRLSTFDLYSSEVVSGNLQWTPAHKNEIFWRENIHHFEERGYKLVGRLIELLADDEDLVREIACHDLGEFSRFAPEGKRVVNRLGGKAKLMINLQHKNPKVSKAALLATQKLMVANWEYLAKNSSGGVAALVQKGSTNK